MRPQLQWRQRLFPRLRVFHIPSWRIEGSETTVRGARARERVDAVVVLPLNKAGGEGGGCKGGLRRWGIVFWPWLVLATVVVLDVPLYQGWCVLSVNATGA
jgi:hypothetical protein